MKEKTIKAILDYVDGINQGMSTDKRKELRKVTERRLNVLEGNVVLKSDKDKQREEELSDIRYTIYLKLKDGKDVENPYIGYTWKAQYKPNGNVQWIYFKGETEFDKIKD